MRFMRRALASCDLLPTCPRAEHGAHGQPVNEMTRRLRQFDSCSIKTGLPVQPDRPHARVRSWCKACPHTGTVLKRTGARSGHTMQLGVALSKRSVKQVSAAGAVPAEGSSSTLRSEIYDQHRRHLRAQPRTGKRSAPYSTAELVYLCGHGMFRVRLGFQPDRIPMFPARSCGMMAVVLAMK